MSTPASSPSIGPRKNKHPHHEEPESHERWLVSYADFITLLFAFFVVLYATSNSDIEKQKQFEKSVRTNLKLVAGGGAGNAVGNVASSIPSQNSLTEIQKAVQELNSPLGQMEQPEGGRENEDELNKTLEKFLGSEEREKNIGEIKHEAMGLRIALKASAFFATGSAKLKPTGLKTLDQIAAIIKQTDRKVLIEGHTDDQVVHSPLFESNWELSSNRATTVVRYLIKVHSVSAVRLAAVSYADQKPLAPNDSEENRAKNRRIEVLITRIKE